MNLKFEEIKRWMDKYGIQKFLFKKPVRVVLHIFGDGSTKDEIEIVGIYARNESVFAFGSGINNLKFASDKILDAVIQNLEK